MSERFNRSPRSAAPAFTLIELLTVVFIISLLIGILVPSLSAARTAAKKAVSSKALQTITVGLEMFSNDNGAQFPQTNGYPPSFAHPPIRGVSFKPDLGEFPFFTGNPQVYGAHWLPAMLMGVDTLGYIQRGSVPTKNNLRIEPHRWYTPDPLGPGTTLDRAPLYVDPGNLPMLKTKDLPGRPDKQFFPNWDNDNPFGTQNLPVIVDGFDYPVLYYVANKHGRTTNMVEREHLANNTYTGGPQREGVPYYFHQDNAGFTGTDIAPATGVTGPGWNFNGEHTITRTGADLDAAQLILPENRDTFARYVAGRKLFRNLEDVPGGPPPASPLRPVNSDSFLLISPGADGRYGTNDDISNLPGWPD